MIRNFCWHQNFVPKGLSVPSLGLYTCINSFKLCLKLYFKEIVLKLATDGQSDKGFLLTSTFVLYTCIKALKYIPGPGVGWAFTGPLVLRFYDVKEIKLYSNGYCHVQAVTDFLLVGHLLLYLSWFETHLYCLWESHVVLADCEVEYGELPLLFHLPACHYSKRVK